MRMLRLENWKRREAEAQENGKFKDADCSARSVIRPRFHQCGLELLVLQVHWRTPIGAAGRPNRRGSYETGSDGAAGGPPGVRWVPRGPRRARGDAGGSRMSPYINRAPMRDSRATCRALSGPVLPKQGSGGNPPQPDMTPGRFLLKLQRNTGRLRNY